MEDMFDLTETLFGGIWDLCSRVIVPGFGISLAKVLIGFFVIKWSLNLLGLVTGFRTNADTASTRLRSSTESYRHYKTIYDKKGGSTP